MTFCLCGNPAPMFWSITAWTSVDTPLSGKSWPPFLLPCLTCAARCAAFLCDDVRCTISTPHWRPRENKNCKMHQHIVHLDMECDICNVMTKITNDSPNQMHTRGEHPCHQQTRPQTVTLTLTMIPTTNPDHALHDDRRRHPILNSKIIDPNQPPNGNLCKPVVPELIPCTKNNMFAPRQPQQPQPNQEEEEEER